MTRLPTVGADSNTWGTILNAFLSVAHNADGSIMNLFTNVKDPAYGATGGGVTDDTTAIQAAITAAQSAGGGVVFFPAGTYIVSVPLTITADNITLLGIGNASALQAAAGFTGAAMIYYAGGSGIHRTTIRSLRFKGPSGTYSSNPACDGIQFNSDVEDTILADLHFDQLNGWAVEVLAGSTGFIGYTNMVNCVARSCKQGYHFASTVPASNRSGGFLMTNCVADNCQNGDAYLFDEITDNVMTNCQGYSQTGSSLHIKGSAFLYISNCDLGGAAPTAPCVLIEAGSSHSNDHINLYNVFMQKGTVGLSITAAAHTRITDCDVYFNQGHGISVLDNANNGVISIRGCHFYQNNQNNIASQYDLNSTDNHGELLVRDCTFETTVGSGAGKVAASLSSVDFWQGLTVLGNHFLGGTPVFSPSPIHKTMIKDNEGYNPVGSLTAPAVPATTVAQQNDRGVDCTVIIATLGTLTAVAIGGTAITPAPAAGSQYRVPALQTITLTYSGAAPTWQWFGD